MRTLHQSLHLQHRQHTGKLLHHQHTSYHALALIFAVAGLFIAGLNVASRVAADDFGVAATVAAPVPTNPPTITAPSANANISGSSALVIGSCPMVTPQAVVSINVDGTPAGTSACDGRNDFSVPITFTSGSHQLTATALTVTGGKGPTTPPVQVHTARGNTAPPIVITADQPYVYAGGKDITWVGDIGLSGQGTEYAHIDWGDNSQSNYTVQAGPQRFSHHYAVLTSHNILVAASNTGGGASNRQFAASAFTTFTPTTFVSSHSNTSPFGTSSTLIGLYGLYLTALSITGIIWLEAKHAARQHQHAIA